MFFNLKILLYLVILTLSVSSGLLLLQTYQTLSFRCVTSQSCFSSLTLFSVCFIMFCIISDIIYCLNTVFRVVCSSSLYCNIFPPNPFLNCRWSRCRHLLKTSLNHLKNFCHSYRFCHCKFYVLMLSSYILLENFCLLILPLILF